MRRLLSFILFLCVTIGVYAQTDYGLTVAGTEVTSSNAGDILGDGKVSYDAVSKTLHLKDADIQSYGTGIAAKDKITIDLTGNSTIDATTCFASEYNAADNSDFGTTITSSSGGTLNLVGRDGILSFHGGLLITDCTLNAECSMSALNGDLYGQNKTLKIVHSDINLKGTATDPCISNYETFILDRCQIAEPSDAFFKYEWGYGAMYQGTTDNFCVSLKIKADKGSDYGISGATLNDVAFTVNSENYADVLGDGTLSYNPEQNTLTMNGTHLYGLIVFDLCKPDLRINIVGTQNSIEGYCMINTSCTLVGNNTKKAVTSQLNVNSIGLASSLTIQNLAVEFIGSKLGFQSQSGTASLTLRNATVNANAAEGVFKYIPSLVLEDCEILTPEGAYYDAEKKYIVDESGNRVTGVVTIGPKVEPVVGYGIWIGFSPYDRLEITSENCSDVLGDGTVSYDPATNVLSLNNLQAPDGYIELGELDYDMSIQTMEAMNKDLAGIKVKVIGDNALGSLYFYGGVNGTLCGDGNLLLQKNMDGPTPALHSWDNLLIEDCNLVARGGIGIEMWSYMGAPGKLTIRNATIKIESSLQRECIESLTDLVLDGCYIYSPVGAHYDKEKYAIVDKDGKDVKGNLIIRKGAPQFPGSGTEDDPFILSEGTNTFTTPVGEAYYKYTATEDCVMQIEVKEESGVTGDIYYEKASAYTEKLESREKLVRKGVSIILRIVSTDPDNEVTVKFREIREGETWEKAILLNEGDNPIPAIDRKKVAMWYKLPVPAGTRSVCTFTDYVSMYRNEVSVESIMTRDYLFDMPAITKPQVFFFSVSSMPEGGNANVKLEGPVTPEKGTGTKDDPFVLDGILPPPSPVPGTGEGDPGKPGTGPGGTGTGSYTNPPTIIAPPAGTSSCYTFTATDDCVLGLAVSVGNEFEGKLIINGYDAGNIDDREVLLRKGNVVMLDIANAGKDDLVAVNLREPGEGEIWYKAILLDEGTHTIPAIIGSKNVALWYKVVVPDMRNISLTTSSIGDMAVFAEDDADSEVEGSMVTAGDEGLEYSHDNTTGSDEPLYFKVSDMASGCTATVVFSEELGIIEVTADGTVTAHAYNVSGQRVGNGYKGVTIMNGKKFVRK